MDDKELVQNLDDKTVPDSIMPTQFYQVGQGDPFRMLQVAVLQTAADDIHLPKTKPFLRQEAFDWVFGKIPSLPGFSFGDICENLNIDKNEARRKILRLRLASFPKRKISLYRDRKMKVSHQVQNHTATSKASEGEGYERQQH